MKNLSLAPSLRCLAFAFLATCACSDDTDDNSNGNGNGNGNGNNTTTHWVGTWATGLQATEPRNLPTPVPDDMGTPDDPGFAGQTLRQVVRVSIGGSRLRLRLSNEYGKAPVTMESVHVAKSLGGGAIDTSTDKALAFSGMPSVTIPTGEAVLSDPFDYTLAPVSDLAITMKIGEQSKEVTGHPGSRTTSYLQEGDFVSAAEMPDALKTPHWYFISALDVDAPAKSAAIVVLGDSLTDGRGSNTDQNDRWTDALSKRIQADSSMSHIAVVNQGIGGNAVFNGGIGPSAKARFDQDVLATPGVKWVIVLEGVNDIGNASTDISDQLIAEYAAMVAKARAAKVKAYGVPILPFKGNMGYGTEERLEMRRKVNEWIRTPGNFDAVIDLDEAVRDPADPEKLKMEYADPSPAGVDYLHLNPAGYQAMGDAVPFDLFK